MRIGAERHACRSELEVEPRILQFGADDGERIDAERFQLLGARRHLRQRAAAERTIQPGNRAEQQRRLPAVVGQANRSIILHRRHGEIGRVVSGFDVSL